MVLHLLVPGSKNEAVQARTAQYHPLGLIFEQAAVARNEDPVFALAEVFNPVHICRVTPLRQAGDILYVIGAVTEMADKAVQRTGQPGSCAVVEEDPHAARDCSLMPMNSMARRTEAFGTS